MNEKTPSPIASSSQDNEIILYQPDSTVKLEVRLENETVWPLIIDDTLYHIGASVKDLGKKLFAFSQMEVIPADELILRLEKSE